MQPGWYPDPFSTAGLRWWDGTAWTGHTAPAAAHAVQPTRYGIEVADPVRDLAGEQRWATRASQLLVLAAVLTALGYLFSALVLGHVLHDFFHQLNLSVQAANANSDSTVNVPPLPGRIYLFDLLGLINLVPTVILIVWLYQATTVSSRLGIPARRSQIWVVLGFIVPVVSLWFPFQVAQDTMPPGDPGRRIVGRWWAWYLIQGFVGVPLVIVSIFSRPIAVLLALIAMIAPLMAARCGRAMIATVLASHGRLLGAVP